MRFLWIIIFLVAVSGCKKNAGCTDFGTENYDPEAIINDGSCILVRDKFLGNFQVSSDCFASDYNRTISITQNEFVVTISNLADTLGIVDARVYGNNITIEPQSVHTSIIIEGAGVYLEENKISLSYRIRDFRSGTEIIHDCFELCTKL